MADGKIAAVGEAGKIKIPKGAKVVDAKGMTVYPGLIDPESNFGLTEISADQMTNDLVERSDEIMPHMHVYDAFHSDNRTDPCGAPERHHQRSRGAGERGHHCRAGHFHSALRRRSRPDDHGARCRAGHELRRRSSGGAEVAGAAAAEPGQSIPRRAWA